MTFNDLDLIEPILRALKNEGYTNPTPIQEQAIPAVLDRKDVLGCAQTGTGKTAAFVIPILQLLIENKIERKSGAPSVLILSPTRELAIQIGESIEAYGSHTKIRHTVIFGGVSQYSQVMSLRNGVDILVATPGRLKDLMQQGYINLKQVKFFVLDEADRMLDMGFVEDVKRIIARLPEQKQSLFFSATMAPAIKQLADRLLVDPVKVEVTPVSSTADRIEQFVYFVEKKDKLDLLKNLLQDSAIKSVLVFIQMKFKADQLTKSLVKAGITAEAIHGNKSQNRRQEALENFKSGRTRVLVATDIAARGIDVDGLTHVINFDLPNVPETYVHRIGRTGRAGAEGTSLSFCDWSEKPFLTDIQKLIKKNLPIVQDHPFAIKSLGAPVSSSNNSRNSNAQPSRKRSGRSRVFMQV